MNIIYSIIRNVDETLQSTLYIQIRSKFHIQSQYLHEDEEIMENLEINVHVHIFIFSVTLRQKMAHFIVNVFKKYI